MTIYGIIFLVFGAIILLANIFTALLNVAAAIYLRTKFPTEWLQLKENSYKAILGGPKWFQAASSYFKLEPLTQHIFFSLNKRFKRVYSICDNCLLYIGSFMVLYIIVCNIFKLDLVHGT